MAKQNEYNKIMDALNFIDEQAESSSGDYDADVKRSKAYEKVADFIDKHAKRNQVAPKVKARKPTPERWSRKGKCPSCKVGTGSRHRKDCLYDYFEIETT